MTLRQTIADGPASIGERMRARRWDVLLSTFPRLAEYDVLDLGGTAGSWLRKDVRPRSLTLLNLEATELTVDAAGAALPEWITIRTGDACAPPPDIAERRFDLIFSNSLIEHVGGPAKRQAMADFVKLAAPGSGSRRLIDIFLLSRTGFFRSSNFFHLRPRHTCRRSGL